MTDAARRGASWRAVGRSLRPIPLPPGALAYFIEQRAAMHGLVMLELLGYHVLEADNGLKGVEVAAAQRPDVAGALAPLAHQTTWLCVAAERAVSRAMGGSCSMPLAAHAVWQGDTLQVSVALGDPESTTRPLLRAETSGPAADESAATALGVKAADLLRAQGAASYLPVA